MLHDPTAGATPKAKPFRRPNLCRHKASKRGYVTWQGKEHYFLDKDGKGIPWPDGLVKEPEAIRLAYDAFLAKIYSGQETKDDIRAVTIAEVSLLFLKYVKAELPNREFLNYRASLRPLNRYAGHRSVAGMGSVGFLEFRNYLVDTPVVRKRVEGGKRVEVNGRWTRVGGKETITERPRTRSGVNKVMKLIRQVLKWSVKMQVIPPGCLEAIKAVPALRCQDRDDESELLPVHDEAVRRTLAHLPRVLAAMVRLQRITAMRPGELCRIRMSEIDRSDRQCWWYFPKQHKNRWRGRKRSIPLGPQCQEILKPFLKADPERPLFSPADRIREWRAEQRAERKTRVQPSQYNRAKLEPSRIPGQAYSTASYGRAIAVACAKAGVERWTPNQLRKAAADEILNTVDIDHAQALLGHSDPIVTKRFYAVRDKAKARAAAMQIVGV